MALYAFDGTWNSEEKDQGKYGENTNVVKFARLYHGPRTLMQKKGDQPHVIQGDEIDDDTFYVSGVGTRHGKVGRVVGGLLGAGGRTRIEEGKKAVKANFARGDRDVDIIGFSRGAALALDFANALNEEGIPVRFLGLWDVVAAFGVPIDVGPLRFQETNIGHRLTLPPNVQHCYHAAAMDERRQAFRVTRVDNGYQVWFRGVHSDVGGGNDNEGLSNIALRWMLRKAKKLGVPVRDGCDDLKCNVNAGVMHSSQDLIKNAFRTLTNKDRFHYTVTKRTGDCQNSPEGCAVETEADERDRVKL